MSTDSQLSGVHQTKLFVSRNAILRLADSFFKRWFLYLLPFLLLLGIGAATAAQSKSRYLSEGVMYVESQTLLANLTKARDTPASYRTPSSIATDQLSSLKRTDGFMKRVVDGAKLTAEVKSGVITVNKLRSSISIFAEGDNLVHVRALSEDARGAALLASSTIESFRRFVIDANVAESTAAKTFLDTLVISYQKDVEIAHQALDDFVVSKPEADVAKRSLADQIEFERLVAASAADEARLAAAINKREDARLATEQTTSDVSQRLRVVDPPVIPMAPEASRKQAVLSTALLAFLGLFLSGAATVAGAASDRSIRFASDVTERLRVPVLAVLHKQ